MKILLLNGHGISMHVDSAKLHIKDGRFSTEEDPAEYVFSPQRCDIDTVVIYGRNGNISIDAIRWLMKHKVQVTVLNWDGKLLTTMLPHESTQAKVRFAQYRAYEEQSQRLKIAKKILKAKFERTQIVLDYLLERYPEVETDFSTESSRLRIKNTIPDLLMVEANVALFYWDQIQKIIPKKYDFDSRKNRFTKRPSGSGDMVNCLLNYGYSLLEAECVRAIYSTGLDVHVGFLHEMRQGKYSLAYDLQELFRFLIDLAVLNLIERERFVKKDFIRTESYTLRLRPSGARKLTEEINLWFNKTVPYLEKEQTWRTVIFLKTRELVHYLDERRKDLDFRKPEYVIERFDSEDIRKKILSISYSDWKKAGFSKGSLHYMKQNAKGRKPFSLNEHVHERLALFE